MRRLVYAFGTVCVTAAVAAGADIFDQQTGTDVRQWLDDGKPVAELSMEDAARLKPLSAGVSSPCLVIKTDEGNYTKALVSWGFRKGATKPLPVLLIERYVTYRQDRPELTTAHGKDVMLFPGYGFNFDIGQVVPQGQGADLEFTPDSRLKTLDAAQLVPMSGQPRPDTAGSKPATDHEGVLPQDFAGTWTIDVDGRWQGELRLKSSENGRLTGTFVSDESRNSYDVSGQVAALPHQLKLDLFLANSQMAVEGYLWTTDKSKMAGVATLSGRKFGFVAQRVTKP